MDRTLAQRLERLLRRVEKPARYTGGETNQVVKDPAAVRASVCLAFPDVYDIGMSYHGYKILYELVNKREAWAAERAFAPWPDMEAAMRGEGLPLYALETKRPIREFDLIGFTLQHEVNFSNVLNMIDLAGLPLLAKDRAAAFPLLVGGGEGALTPEPLAPFLDLFVLGDGEGPMLELLALVEAFRAEGGTNKTELLRRAEQIAGVYAPAFYELEHNDDGSFKRIYRIDDPNAPTPVIKKALWDMREDLGPVKPVVPNLRVIHDRLAIEIKRGCTRGCRFCAAGMITRPVRERLPQEILEVARQGVRNTGFDEISLLSLSSADYSVILPTVRLLKKEFEGRQVSISMPSLRINAFDVSLADELTTVRKSGFTFAPEAGSERLRKVINKPVEEFNFLKIIEKVCQRGWKTLKFYFMIGLPTETDEDLDGLVKLVRQAEEIGRHYWGNALKINVGISNYVPKPHTPFQWEAQATVEELGRRINYLRDRLRSNCIVLKTHGREISMVEAVLARGDRRVGMAMMRAWEKGVKFDGWSEHFRFDLWMEAFAEEGIDPAYYAHRERGEAEVFPWEHVETGLGRRFLLKEWKLALREREVADCSTHACTGCNVCGPVIDHKMADEVWQAPEGLAATRGRYEDFGQSAKLKRPEFRRSKVNVKHARLTPVPSAAAGEDGNVIHPVDASAMYEGLSERLRRPRLERATDPPPRQMDKAVQRLRFHYSRVGDLKYLSHLDVMKVVQMALTRAGFRIAYTEGFSQKAKLWFLPPLPLGYETPVDLFDVALTEWVNPEAARASLDSAFPAGLRALGCEEMPMRSPAPDACIERSDYEIRLPADLARGAGLTEAGVGDALEAFRIAESFPYRKRARAKKAAKSVDLKRCVVEAGDAAWDTAGGFVVRLGIAMTEADYVEPLTALNGILGCELAFEDGVDVARAGITLRALSPAASELTASE